MFSYVPDMPPATAKRRTVYKRDRESTKPIFEYHIPLTFHTQILPYHSTPLRLGEALPVPIAVALVADTLPAATDPEATAGSGDPAGHSISAIVASSDPFVMVIHPGNFSTIGPVCSLTSGGCIGHWSAKSLISLAARGAQSLIVPSAVLAHWAIACVCTSISHPFMKSPWKP